MEALKKKSAKGARRVLVVDDNRDATRMLTLLLGNMGFDVRTAATGSEGLELARAYLPDYALLDIVLPDVDGCDLAKDLRGLPGMDAAKIVAITAYDDDRARTRAVEAGCNAYFLKPLSAMLLADVLECDSAPRAAEPSLDDTGVTLQLLDDVISEVERLLGQSSAIGLDRARLSIILTNCTRVRDGLTARGVRGEASGLRSSEQPQFLDDEERAEVTALVRQLDLDHPVRRAFETGVDTRRLGRIADLRLRQRLQAAYTAAIRRWFQERGSS